MDSLAILKMVGVLLAHAPTVGRAAMVKAVGFDAMWLLLAPFPVTADLCDVLVGIGTRNGRRGARAGEHTLMGRRAAGGGRRDVHRSFQPRASTGATTRRFPPRQRRRVLRPRSTWARPCPSIGA